MLLSLSGRDTTFSKCYGHLLQALRVKAHVTNVFTAEDALQHLDTSDLAAVLVTDSEISEKRYRNVLTKLVDYTKSGRPVVFGGTFGATMLFPEFPKFFGSWGVQWKAAAYTKDEFAYNPAVNSLFKEDSRLPPSLPYMKGVYLMDFGQENAVYLQHIERDDAEDDADDEFTASSNHRKQPIKSPVVYARVGKGWLGYIGFVNAEEVETDVVLAMLRL